MSTDGGVHPADSEAEERYRKMITCPVCMMYCPPPLQTCSNGHITCGGCLKTPLKKCPVCRVKIDHKTAPRNLLFEEVIQDLPLLCPNSVAGCKRQVRFQDLKAHLAGCRAGLPSSVCQWCSCAFKRYDGWLDHEALCPSRQVTCNMCAWCMPACDYPKHLWEEHGPGGNNGGVHRCPACRTYFGGGADKAEAHRGRCKGDRTLLPPDGSWLTARPPWRGIPCIAGDESPCGHAVASASSFQLTNPLDYTGDTRFVFEMALPGKSICDGASDGLQADLDPRDGGTSTRPSICLCLDVHVPRRHRKAYLIPRVVFVREGQQGLRVASLQSYNLSITVSTTKGPPAAAAAGLLLQPAAGAVAHSVTTTTGNLPLKVHSFGLIQCQKTVDGDSVLGHALPCRGDREGWNTVYHMAIRVEVVHCVSACRAPATRGEQAVSVVPAMLSCGDAAEGTLREAVDRGASVPHAEGKVKHDSVAGGGGQGRKRQRAQEEEEEEGEGGEARAGPVAPTAG